MTPQTRETLDEVESLYGRVLDLTRRQEACLAQGDLSPLPALLSEKAQIVARTQALMHRISQLSERSDSDVQGGVRRLAEILKEIVATENRCATFAPSSPAPPRRVISAYGRR